MIDSVKIENYFQRHKLNLMVQFSFFLISLGLIIVFALVGIYAYPVADDFSHAWKPVGFKPMWDTVVQVYLGHGGLYSAVFFRYLHATLTRMQGYWLVAWIILIGLGILLYFISRYFLARKESILLTLGCLALFLVKMPHVGEFLYWATGALVYATGTFMVLLLLLMNLKLFQTADPGGLTGLKTAIIATVILMIGTHWPFAIWGVLWVLTCTVIVFKSRRPDKHFWLILSVLAIVCFVIVLVAPGNVQRAGGAEKALSMTFREFGKSAFGYFQISYGFLFNIPMLALSGLTVTILTVHGIKGDESKWPLSGWIVLIVWAIAALGVFAVAAMAGLFPPVGRTLDALFFMFIVSWILFLFLNAHRFIEPIRSRLPTIFLNQVKLGFIVVFLISILLDGNFRLAFMDLIKHGPAFSQEMQFRNRALKTAAAAGLECTTVAPINAIPKTFYWDDLNGDPTDWKIPSMARFYGLKTIAVEGHTPCP